MTTLTIGKKISLACIALVTLTIILGTVAIWKVNTINDSLHVVVEGPLPGFYSLGRIQGHVKEQKVTILEHVISTDAQEMKSKESMLAELERKLQAELTTYEKTIQTVEARQLFQQFAPVHERFNAAGARIIALSRALQTKAAMTLWLEEGLVASADRAKLLESMSAHGKLVGDDRANAAIAAGKSANFWALVLLAFSIVSGGGIAFVIVRGINKDLMRSITELSEGAEQVSSASAQVSGSSQSLAQGASEQAASLEETSASSEEMASMTRKNADNSHQAASFMNAVNGRVVEANLTLADMTTSMQQIGDSSNKISKIIKVIDEIAFQTNILALNAAVEAARAGEAGMGFAVVADEVRNLAQRSAQAAKDTASLIEESILKSGEGSKKLGEVAGSIQAITEGANKVKTLVDEVEASSKEQAQGIEQISKAVAQMDEVTQRTAANAEESASASEELNAQSQALMSVVGRLQTMVGAGSSTPELSTKPLATKSITPKRILRKTAARVLAGAGVGRTGGFSLDDSDFKEF